MVASMEGSGSSGWLDHRRPSAVADGGRAVRGTRLLLLLLRLRVPSGDVVVVVVRPGCL